MNNLITCDTTVSLRVITFGTFDMLHIGHLRILQRAKAMGGHLIVGISTDKLNAVKGKSSVIDEDSRREIVSCIRCVDEVFMEESLEDKASYIIDKAADILVMGDDWAGKFDHMPCKVIYLSRTPSISSTEIKKVCASTTCTEAS